MNSLWMLLAGLGFAAMGVFVKLGSGQFSLIELVFYRSLVSLGIVSIPIVAARQRLCTPHWQGHLWRSLSGGAALVCYFYAITRLPVATAVTLNYTSSIFLALILSLWYRQRPGLRAAAAIALGFVGVVLVLRPTLHREQLPAGLLGLGSGFLAALAYINVRALSARGEPEWRVVFYFTALVTLASGGALPLQPVHAIRPDNGWLLVGMGVAATLGQICMTRAYGRGNPLTSGALAYSAVVYAALFGTLLLEESLDSASWAGVAVITAAGIMASRPLQQAKDHLPVR